MRSFLTHSKIVGICCLPVKQQVILLLAQISQRTFKIKLFLWFIVNGSHFYETTQRFVWWEERKRGTKNTTHTRHGGKIPFGIHVLPYKHGNLICCCWWWWWRCPWPMVVKWLFRIGLFFTECIIRTSTEDDGFSIARSALLLLNAFKYRLVISYYLDAFNLKPPRITIRRAQTQQLTHEKFDALHQFFFSSIFSLHQFFVQTSDLTVSQAKPSIIHPTKPWIKNKKQRKRRNNNSFGRISIWFLLSLSNNRLLCTVHGQLQCIFTCRCNQVVAAACRLDFVRLRFSLSCCICWWMARSSVYVVGGGYLFVFFCYCFDCVHSARIFFLFTFLSLLARTEHNAMFHWKRTNFVRKCKKAPEPRAHKRKMNENADSNII